MDIKVLGSSSAGNCYVVSDGYSKIMLDCGLPFKKIQQLMNFNLGGITACLLSHEHKDHALAVKDIIKRGIPVYSSEGTLKTLDIPINNRISAIKAMVVYPIGSFAVRPFGLIHDATEPFGYLLTSFKTGEVLVFVTDTMYCPFRFTGLTHILVECNYVDELLITKGNDKHSARVVNTHMGLNTCLNFLKINDLSKVKEIMLIHLSDSSSDEDLILERVRMATGKHITIAPKENI